MRKAARSIVLGAAVLGCLLSAATWDELKAGFVSPPDAARPGVYWYFMERNLDREAITADLSR